MTTGQGIETTFQLLARTENEAAAQVLAAALDSPYPDLAERALAVLLKRRSLAGQHEVIRRIHQLDDHWRAIVHEHRGTMSQALRDALLSTDARWCANSCQAILWFHEYDLMPTLINVLEDDTNPNASLAAATALELAELFYDDLSGAHDFRPRRDPQTMLRHLTKTLEESVKRYARHRRTEPVEAFLLLANRDNLTLKQILLDPLNVSYLAVIEVLTRSRKPGIIRLLLSYLDDPQTPSAPLTAIAHRDDREFVEPFLRRIGSEPSPAVRRNLARIEHFAWLRPGQTLIDELDEAAQHSTIELLAASGMNRLQAFQTISHLVLHGKPDGRRAAVRALAAFHGIEANQLAMQAIDDEDPYVQALALAQLRERGIPGAVSLLIERTESPLPVVQQAARESLSEFSFARYLSAFDMLEEQVRRSTGLLVRKIDPQTVPMLREELVAASGRRRMRALQMAETMHLAPQVEEDIVKLVLHDEDHLVRLGAAKALAQCRSLAAIEALHEAEHDKSGSVREAALHSLEQIGKLLAVAKEEGSGFRVQGSAY